MKTSHQFIRLGLGLLILGLLFGIVGALQYILPGFLKAFLSFEKIRPLHVSSVIFWIIMAAVGCVLHYLEEHTGRKLRYANLSKIQLLLFSIALPLILVSYLLGIFGGREYWEFHPILALPIVVGWILFLVNFFATLKSLKQQPVYVWMWVTGIIFFLFTFLESYIWLIPYFRQNIVSDMTIQWKSYGSMVGSWNMLIYGSSIYLMDKISGNKKYSHSKTAFLIYFLGLFNLMFNWGHHIYSLPAHASIRYISYGVSMTELLLLGRILYLWRSSLDAARKHMHKVPYKFLAASEIWVFFVLAQAIMMSVPAINLYTHGTHVTVAHTMGATIGINTMLLLAYAYDILGKSNTLNHNKRLFTYGYYLANASLFLFCISLNVAGILRARWQMDTEQLPFGAMMQAILPFMIVFCVAGVLLALGLFAIIRHLFLEHKFQQKKESYD